MAKTKIKVGFAGTPKIAFDIFSEILSSKDISTEFVLTQPDKSSGRGLVTSKSLFANIDNVPMLQPESLSGEELIKKIEAFNIDLLVVVAYGKILPLWCSIHLNLVVSTSIFPTFQNIEVLHQFKEQ